VLPIADAREALRGVCRLNTYNYLTLTNT